MILCIDTRNPKIIGVTLKKEGETVASLNKECIFGSQILLPAVVKILQDYNLDFSDLEGIGVEVGPGSFTGLRVGASVAQALGFAVGIPVNGQIGKPVDLYYT